MSLAHRGMKMLHSCIFQVITGETVMALGFKTNPNKSSRNPLAREVRLLKYRVRTIPNKKGRGSYKRKGRIERSFFIPVRQFGYWLWYYEYNKDRKLISKGYLL